MTIDEAIAHCYEVSNREDCVCGEEHLQLAKWLIELKSLRQEKEDNQSDWEEVRGDYNVPFDYWFRCKKCGGNTSPGAYVFPPSYCPNCGRKMILWG